MKNLKVSFSGKALIITNTKTNESIAAVLERNGGIEYHKRFNDNGINSVADKLFKAIRNYIATFRNKKYSYSQRLQNLFSLLKNLENTNTFTKLHNRLIEEITPITVAL